MDDINYLTKIKKPAIWQVFYLKFRFSLFGMRADVIKNIFYGLSFVILLSLISNISTSFKYSSLKCRVSTEVIMV